MKSVPAVESAQRVALGILTIVNLEFINAKLNCKYKYENAENQHFILSLKADSTGK
jgi:hypothetical protein